MRATSRIAAAAFLLYQKAVDLFIAFEFTALGILASVINRDCLLLLAFLPIIDILTAWIIQASEDATSVRHSLKGIERGELEHFEMGSLLDKLTSEACRYKRFWGDVPSCRRNNFRFFRSTAVADAHRARPVSMGPTCVIFASGVCLDNPPGKVIVAHEIGHCIADGAIGLARKKLDLFFFTCIAILLLAGQVAWGVSALIVSILLSALQRRSFQIYAEINANNYAIEMLDSINELSVRASASARKSDLTIRLDLLECKEKLTATDKAEQQSLTLQLRHLMLVEQIGKSVFFISIFGPPALIMIPALVYLVSIRGLATFVALCPIWLWAVVLVSIIVSQLVFRILQTKRKEHLSCGISTLTGKPL